MKKTLVLAYLALISICIIWGTTFLALRIAVGSFPPFLFSALRQVVAGSTILFAALVFMKVPFPSFTYVWQQAIAGFFMITIGNGLVAWAEITVPSGIAAILCSLMPIVVILINVSINREERPNALIIFGVLIGLIGIVMIFGENLSEFSNPAYVAGIVAIIIAVFGWAGGSVWVKKRNTESNIYMNAGLQMFFGGLWLFVPSVLFENYSNIVLTPQAVYPFIYLVVFGSIIAYVAYSYALRNLPMTVVSLYAYINPLVAVLLGWLVLDEKLNKQIGFAFVITVAGIYLVNKGYQQLKEWRTALSDR